MAFIDSIKSYQVSLSNIEAGIYQDFSFKMARYEGESASDVFLRIVSFLHSFDTGRKLLNREGFWHVESIDSNSNANIRAMIGLPDWKLLDHEVKRLASYKGMKADVIDIYLTNPEDYQTILHRIKSRKLNGIEFLNIFLVKFDEDNLAGGILSEDTEENEAIIRADSWDVVIIDGSLVQLSIKNKIATHLITIIVEKRDVWADYQNLLQDTALKAAHS